MERIITCLLIRHGNTPGNLEKRYIGKRSDESLAGEGIEELKKRREAYSRLVRDGEGTAFYSGVMKRCRETMDVLFPEAEYKVLDTLTEIDFGDFEGHNYSELSGNEDYQRWIDSNGELPFPNGESRERFIERTCDCLKQLYSTSLDSDIEQIVTVCHGGNIMAFMSTATGENYFDFMLDPGDGYEAQIRVTEEKIDVISYHRIFDGLHT